MPDHEEIRKFFDEMFELGHRLIMESVRDMWEGGTFESIEKLIARQAGYTLGRPSPPEPLDPSDPRHELALELLEHR